MKKIGLVLIVVLSLLFALYVSFFYIIVDYNQAPFIVGKKQLFGPQSTVWYFFLFMHVIGSLASVIVGPFMFIDRLRIKYIKWHRGVGIFYYLSILLGSISGFYLSFFATGGLPAAIGLLLLSLLWFFTAFQAFRNIRQKNVKLHQQWMIRNYSLTFATVTLRLWLPITSLFVGGENFPLSFAISIWISWVLNLLFAEWIIKRKQATAKTIAA